MALDDLVDDSKESRKQKEVNEASDELGVDNLEELKQFSDSVQHLRKIVMIHDSKLEEIDRVQRDVDDLREEIEALNDKIDVIVEKIKNGN